MRMLKLFLLLFPGFLLAQSVPNGTIIQGQIWTPAQWNAAWQSKADVGQTRELSSIPGANCDGVTDSHDAVATAFAAVQGTNTVLLVDCPVYIATGLDYTKAIFVVDGTNLQFTSNGAFVVDNIGTPVFVFENSSNSTWINTQLRYNANFGVIASTPSIAPFSPANRINSVTILNYLTAAGRNTFTSGGLPISAGASNNNTLIMIRGASNNLNFIGGSATVPAGVAASNFIPMVFSLSPEWNAGVTGITSSTTVTTANTTLPSNITISGWTFDGTYFGIQGGASNLIIKDITSRRYSDLQDGTSGSVTFTGTLSGGATSGTLAMPWASPTGTYGLSFPLGATTSASGTAGTATITFAGGATIPVNSFISISGMKPTGYNGSVAVTASSPGSISYSNPTTASQTVAGTVSITTYVPLTLGSTAAGPFSTSLPGSTISAVAGSGNVGGITYWFSPPHLLYVNSNAGQALTYPWSSYVSRIRDVGPYVGIATRRSVASGALTSLKMEPSNSILDDYTSYRPDGIADLQANGNTGGVVRGLYGEFDSSTLTADGSNSVWGVRFPSSAPFVGLVMENITLRDNATIPTQYPFQGLVFPGTKDINVHGLKVYVNDWPVGASYQPGPEFVGNRINVQADLFFAACNSATQGRGALQVNGNFTTNSSFDYVVHGWRQPTVTFTSTLSIGATTGTLTSNWLFPTGTYQITFSDGEIRTVTLTLNSTTVGTFSTPLTSGVTANAVAIGTLWNNYAQFKQRIILTNNGSSTGNYARIRDVTNGWEGIFENGLQTEHWSQMWAGTPTGATYATPMVFPATMAIDAVGYRVGTNLDTSNGLTTVGVGWTGTPTALLSAQLPTTSFTPNPAFAPVSLGGSAQTILLTPTAGTFGTTGLLQLSIRGTQMLGAN